MKKAIIGTLSVASTLGYVGILAYWGTAPLIVPLKAKETVVRTTEPTVQFGDLEVLPAPFSPPPRPRHRALPSPPVERVERCWWHQLTQGSGKVKVCE